MAKTLDFLRQAYEATKSAEAAVSEVASGVPFGTYLEHVERAQLGLGDARASLLRLIDDREAWGG